MSEYHSNFYIVPTHIRKLPGMTLALLDFYETIFQFLNKGKLCFLKNDAIKERTGIKSISTIQEAFKFFEKHGVMKRIVKNGKRYIVQTLAIEDQTDENDLSLERQVVDNSKLSTDNSPKNDQAIAVPIGGYRCTDREGIAVPIHNNNNINNKNINKSSASSFEKHKTKVYDNNRTPFADVTKQTTSFGYHCETQEESQRKYEENMKRYA